MKLIVKDFNNIVKSPRTYATYEFDTPEELEDIIREYIDTEQDFDLYINPGPRESKIELVTSEYSRLFCIEYWAARKPMEDFNQQEDNNFVEHAIDYIINDIFG